MDFDHVSFSYRQGKGKPVLQDIDLHIEAGQTIAVYLGGVRQSAAQFTVQNTSPGSCPLTIQQDGTIVCGTALADTTIYIRCGTSEGRYILGGP